MSNQIDDRSRRKIVIIGAGPGGLTLARILQLNGIDVKIYEREDSIDARSQGGTLDLHVESGQYALRLADLFDQFQSLCRPEGQDMRIYDKLGNLLFENRSSDEDFDRPEIDRGDLRQLLLNSLKQETILQGYSLKTIQQIENGQYELHFDNGLIDYADLVIGADGAWSHVRPLVTNIRPDYSGLTMIEIEFTNVDQQHPTISELVGRGTAFALADRKGLIAQRNSQNRIRIYICLSVDENWINKSKIEFNQNEETRSNLMNFFSDWHSSLVDLIRYSDSKIIPRRIYLLPIEHRWTTRPGVTLIGDAAHLMSPFAGEGVNLAMIDAADLALTIVNCSKDLTEEIHQFEEKMFNRAKNAAQESETNLKLMIAEGDAAKRTAELFQNLIGNEINRS